MNFATSELIIQFNKTFAPGTRQFYISHKTGLAVTLDSFEAVSGEGVDTLRWTTQSEFENLGFNLWRRVAPAQDMPDSLSAAGEMAAGIANALQESRLAPEELKAMGFVRINPNLVPGAEGGSSSSTRNYLFVDRSAAFGTTYETCWRAWTSPTARSS